MAAGAPGSLQRLLVDAAAQLVALRRELEHGHSLTQRAGELHRLSAAIAQVVPRGGAGVLGPSLRAAVLALASEVIVANAAVSSSLDALMAADDIEGNARCAAAAALQAFAMSLQHACPPQAESTDSNLAVSVMLAGVAVVECGSKASATQYLSASHADYHAHCFSRLVGNLQCIGSRHSQALQILRATTFKPAIVLACLRRMLRLRGPGDDEPDLGAIGPLRGGSHVLGCLLAGNTLFEEERAAIQADAALQRACFACLLTDVRRCVSEEERDLPTARSDYASVCAAMWALATRPVHHTVCARAHREELIRVLLGSVDFFLRADVPSGLVDGHRLRSEALMAPPIIMGKLCTVDMENGDIHPMATAHAMPVLLRVAAVLIHLLEHPSGVCGEEAVLLADALRDLLISMNESSTIRSGAGAPVPAAWDLAAPPGQFAESLRVAEALVRLVAALPKHLPSTSGADPQLPSDLTRLAATVLLRLKEPLGRVYESGAIASEDALAAAPGLVDSIVKLAHRLAATGAQAADFSDEFCAMKLTFFNIAALHTGLVFEAISVVALRDAPAATGPAQSTYGHKRWQAMALAVWSAAEQMQRRKERGPRHSSLHGACIFFGLLNGLFWWFEVRMLLLESDAGRRTVLRVYESMLEETTGPGLTLEGSNLQFSIANLAINISSPYAALALVRTGAVTLLTRWAQQQQSRDQARLRAYLVTLDMIQAIVSKAVRGLVQPEVRGAYVSISHPDVCSPGLLEARYWQDLERLVLAPIVAAVHAGAEADAGMHLLWSVAAAEALASRGTCAHVGCTTMAGASEAAMRRGKLCGSCQVLRYCGPACQKADWRGHKAACRELQRRKAEAGGG